MSEVAGDAGNAEVVDSGDVTSQEDFREFISAESSEWGDANDDGVLDGLEVEEEVAPDAPVSQVRVDEGRREGTDEVLSRLRTSDPEAARIMSGMQRQMHQNINEWNQLKGGVLGLREQMINQRETGQVNNNQNEEQAEQSGLPDGVSDEHLEMFRAMADHLGYLPRQELEQKAQRHASRANIQQNLVDAYEQYGDQFGELDESGGVRMHPEVQERLRNRLQRLQDPTGGITPLDLYRLEFGAQAPPPQQEQRQQAPVQRQTRPSPSATVRRSSRGGNPRVRIYDPNRNDSAEDVFERAWALGKRQLTGQ